MMARAARKGWYKHGALQWCYKEWEEEGEKENDKRGTEAQEGKEQEVH